MSGYGCLPGGVSMIWTCLPKVKPYITAMKPAVMYVVSMDNRHFDGYRNNIRSLMKKLIKHGNHPLSSWKKAQPLRRRSGAELSIKEGVLENPKVDVRHHFGLHLIHFEIGKISYRPCWDWRQVQQILKNYCKG
jgi:hypothetical protein